MATQPIAVVSSHSGSGPGAVLVRAVSVPAGQFVPDVNSCRPGGRGAGRRSVGGTLCCCAVSPPLPGVIGPGTGPLCAELGRWPQYRQARDVPRRPLFNGEALCGVFPFQS